MLSRRQFLFAIGAAPVASRLGLASQCFDAAEGGRFTARPAATVRGGLSPGLHEIARGSLRPASLVIPPNYSAATPAPFILLLHGATMSAEPMLRWARTPAEQHGAIVFAPNSGGVTWDGMHGSFGDDFAFIDQTLDQIFHQYAVDPKHLAIAGFSDGATYAVSLALMNGDLFTHGICYSAGFVLPGARVGRPKFFFSHGRQDRILPIEECGRRIVADLRQDRYDVRYDEFDGRHTVPPGMVETSLGWFLG